MKPRLKLRFLVSNCAALMQSLAVALPALAVTVLLAPALLFAPPAQATPNTAVAHAPAAVHGIGLAPAGLVAAMARTQAQAAAKNPAYAIGPNGCAKLEGRHSAPVLAGCFGRTGPAFSTGKHTIRLQLSAWGRAGQLRPVTLRRSAPQANRIEYRGQHLVEWWRVLPLGYEQGFTLDQTPAGSGKVVLQLSASRTPNIAHGTLAWGRLRYGKLQVTDANGTVLPATLTARGKIITLAFDAAHARYPVTVDPLVWLQQEVSASDGAANDRFGSSVAISADGSTALVGVSDKNSNRGAAYVYTLANGAWSQVAELTAKGGAIGDGFGHSVALSADGSTALVGAWHSVYAYAYLKPVSGWPTTMNETSKMTLFQVVAGDRFGSSVALSANGTTALVGAPYKTVGTYNNQGKAYVFTFAGVFGWLQTDILTASNGETNDNFGTSVALSANGATALVGAPYKTVGTHNYQGEAYVYTLANGAWSQAAELSASIGEAGDWSGYSVALAGDGSTALVGAWGNYNQRGAAYVYLKPGGGWATTPPPDYTARLVERGVPNDDFGISVALSANGATALVGAYGQGAAYTFEESFGWSQPAELSASDGAAGDDFGYAVALSANGSTALVGAPRKTVNGNTTQGAAYFFTSAELSAVLSAPATVVPGGQFDSQYILTNSASASGPVTVTLPLPATGAAYVSVSASQGSCKYDATSKVATCNLGSIAGNASTAYALLTLKATGTVGSSIGQSTRLTASPNLVQSATTMINSAPIASNLTLTTYAGQAHSGTLPAVVNPSSDTLSYAIASQPTHGTVTVKATTSAFTYTPAGGYSGKDSFTFTAKDTVAGLTSNTATVSITVNATPPPVASNLSLTTYTGQALSGTLPAVVNPSSDTLSYAIASQPTHGTVTVKATTGAFTYTPTSGYSGSDSFTFTAKDTVTKLTSNTATVTTTVKAAPPPPSSGGGGSLSALGLLALALLGFGVMFRKRRGL